MIDSREIIKLLKNNGWYHVRIHGDHWQFRNHNPPGIVTVPYPKKDIPKGTVNSILKQAGLK
ncbi:type II toxin-antitoxin system HicA family toxin [Lentilactobacillus fungorum]|uniref:type II toxin-antitoxin system HicA family toxin n=1 Tax=Lentilactobacillus fungorum TaxID=2201250 RepID=UPI0027E41459|nr:type II toxin-antitoxin system HicA family toxin [Lentilactobacillus fungorum]